jgi:DtxR family Mn-dependent transcriptional regulator
MQQIKAAGQGGNRMAISGSQEDYLEAILELTMRDGSARVRDIADRIAVAKSSVTVALRALSRAGLIHYAPYQLVTLTEKGRAMSEKISGRHRVLRDFMVGVLGVDDVVADRNACRIEHAVEDRVMRRFSCFVEFMRRSRVRASQLPAAFGTYCRGQLTSGRCADCEGRESAAGTV